MSDDQPTVLVVDDEPNVAEAYSMWLSDDYDILTATGGREALARADEDVDVVLLDRRMPNLSGDEVLKEIRDKELPCQVAMVTAVDPDFDIVQMDFDAYVTKPVTQEDLEEVVETLLSVETYEQRLQERFSLAMTRASLEIEKTQHELSKSEQYEDLVAQIDQLDEEIDQMGKDLDEDVIESVLDSSPGR